MKRRLIPALVLLAMVCVAVTPAFAGRSPSRLAADARNMIQRAVGSAESDPATSGDLFQKAFQNAVALTQPKMGQFWQETGLALAARCLHPELFPEVRIAAETYREKFPKGKRLREVLVSLAMLEAAEGNDRQALALLGEAKGLSEGRERQKIESLDLDAALSANYYRTTEKKLAELNQDRKVRRFQRDQKRFNQGTALVNAALKEVAEGRVSGEQAVRTLRDALAAGYFAEEAPAAELLALAEEDSLAPRSHRREVRFFGATRVVTHALAPQGRAHRLQNFLTQYPEAEPLLLGKAQHSLYLLSQHELRDAVRAGEALKKLETMPGFAGKAAIERLLQALAEKRIHEDGVIDLLTKLGQALEKAPFDNGYSPVISPSLVCMLLAQANLVQGNYSATRTYSGELDPQLMVRTIPVRLLYSIVRDDKDLAFRDYLLHEKNMNPGDRKMVDDFLFPLYLPLNEVGKRILAATLVANDHPVTAVKIILDESQKAKRSLNFDHALALLAEVYQKMGSYAEAQNVWSTLRRVFPHSVWIR